MIYKRNWRSFWNHSDVGDNVMLVTIIGCFDETSMLATCKSVTNTITCQNAMLMTDSQCRRHKIILVTLNACWYNFGTNECTSPLLHPYPHCNPTPSLRHFITCCWWQTLDVFGLTCCQHIWSPISMWPFKHEQRSFLCFFKYWSFWYHFQPKWPIIYWRAE